MILRTVQHGMHVCQMSCWLVVIWAIVTYSFLGKIFFLHSPRAHEHSFDASQQAGFEEE